jgi:uncharacterized DUF497 family protein
MHWKFGWDYTALRTPCATSSGFNRTPDNAFEYPGEERILRIGKIENRLWTAILTHRGNNIRIISVRRARQNETRRYETEAASNG